MISSRPAYSEYKNLLRRCLARRIDYNLDWTALLKEKEIFTSLRNRISPHVPNGDIVYKLNEKHYEIYLVFNRRTIYGPDLIMDFSIRYKLGNQEKFYYMDVDIGTLSYAADFFQVFNNFCNLRLYYTLFNSPFHTK